MNFSRKATASITPRRVVISGIGLITPAGGSLAAYWQNITSGRSALSKLSAELSSELSISVGGSIPDSLFEESEKPGDFEIIDRALFLCRTASRRALNDAGIDLTTNEGLEIGLCLGTGAGPTQASEEAYLAFAANGVRALRPKSVTRIMFNSISAHVGIDFKLKGPQVSVAAACASANMAMSRAIDMVRYGRADRVLTGGVEMPLCKTCMAAWSAMRVCSPATDTEKACLPFSKGRQGLVLAEGAAMFMFEELESARARGAKIYAEVLGYGETNDGTHITQPDAASQARAIKLALDDSGLAPEQVDYVNAHGTGTDLNDICESEAIMRVFESSSKLPPVSSTKSVIGHALGASGAVELPAILGAFQNQALPPTANLEQVDPRCTLDYVPKLARASKIDVAISNSFAFGGANSVIVLGRYQ